MSSIENAAVPSGPRDLVRSLSLVSLLLILVLSLLCGPHLAGAAPVPVSGDPGCVSWGPDRIDCVVKTKDGSVWHAYWAGGSWSTWEPLGGVLDSSPAISSWGVDRLDIFGVGQDGALWHSSWGGSGWSGWESVGGNLKFAPDCVSWGSGRIDCFATGADNTVWQIHLSGGSWGTWESIGGMASSGPAAASVTKGNLHVYVVGEEGGLWSNKWDEAQPGWSGWSPVPMAGIPGGIIASQTQPACVANGMNPGADDCFARGTDTALWHTHVGSGTWESLGGGIDSGPAASTWGPGRLDAFAQGSDEGLWHITWSGAGWGAWEPVSMEQSTPPTVTTSPTAPPVTVTVYNTVTVTTQAAGLTSSETTLYVVGGVVMVCIVALGVLMRGRRKTR